MKRLALLTVLAIVPASMVFAQNSLDEEINAELDRMYQTQTRNQAPSVQVNVQASPKQNAELNAGQNQQVAQKQPVTVIEASPLVDSRADLMRKARQEAEMKTETRLVERIELMRLEDERKRIDQLLGEKNQQSQGQVIINQNNGTQGSLSQGAVQASEQQALQSATQPTVAPVIPVAPQQPVYIPVPVLVKDEKKEEVVVKDTNIVDVDVKKNDVEIKDVNVVKAEVVVEQKDVVIIDEDLNKMYVEGLLGMGVYPDVANVEGNYALGFAVGTRVQPRLFVEGTFMYSNYDIQQLDSGPCCGVNPVYPRVTNMDQYSGTGLVKYQFMDGMFRPSLGGLLGYTYRQFSDIQLGWPNNDASSHAIDMGLMAGLDVEVNRTFSIGADFRYMWNILNRSNNNALQTRFSQNVTGSAPIEELNYLTFSLVARAKF